MHRDRLVAFLRNFLAERSEGVVAVYLFGSRARGTGGSRSDVDLAFLYQEVPPSALDAPPRRLESELELELGLPVQVVTLNNAPADLVHRVLRDGEILLDMDRSRRILFEVRARNEYFDLKPVLDRYRRGAAVAR